MATSKHSKPDFAPAWLKFPEQPVRMGWKSADLPERRPSGQSSRSFGYDEPWQAFGTSRYSGGAYHQVNSSVSRVSGRRPVQMYYESSCDNSDRRGNNGLHNGDYNRNSKEDEFPSLSGDMKPVSRSAHLGVWQRAPPNINRQRGELTTLGTLRYKHCDNDSRAVLSRKPSTLSSHSKPEDLSNSCSRQSFFGDSLHSYPNTIQAQKHPNSSNTLPIDGKPANNVGKIKQILRERTNGVEESDVKHLANQIIQDIQITGDGDNHDDHNNVFSNYSGNEQGNFSQPENYFDVNNFSPRVRHRRVSEKLLSSSEEAEQKLLREMGWDEGNDDDHYEITEDEVREFQELVANGKK